MDKIQSGAFAFQKQSNQKINIRFDHCNFGEETFQTESFHKIQWSVQL